VEQKEQKKQTLGIPSRTLLRKRKERGIPFCGIKIEANFRNSIPQKGKQLKIPFHGTKVNAKYRNAVPNHSSGKENNSEQNAAAKILKKSVRKTILRYGQILLLFLLFCTIVCFMKRWSGHEPGYDCAGGGGWSGGPPVPCKASRQGSLPARPSRWGAMETLITHAAAREA
jgi:hypothetical protein